MGPFRPFLESSSGKLHSPPKREILPTVRYSQKNSFDTLTSGSKISERLYSLSRPRLPLSLWCFVYPENFGTLRRVTVSSKKKKLHRPFSVRYCCLVTNMKPKLSFRKVALFRMSLLDTPNANAFKHKCIELSEVISERVHHTLDSIVFKLSQNNFPNKYRTNADRFPWENTVHRRKIPFSRSILFTMWKDRRGPRKEVKTSDGFDTKLKFSEFILMYLDPESSLLRSGAVFALLTSLLKAKPETYVC